MRRLRSALFGSCLVYLPFLACTGGAFSESSGDSAGGTAKGGGPTGGTAPGGSTSAGHGNRAGNAAGAMAPAAGGSPEEPPAEGGAANTAAGGAAGMAEGGSGGGSEPAPPISTDRLVLWFRADAGVKATGDAITNWADQSGNHHDAMQTVESLRPRLAQSASAPLPLVQLDGTDDFLELREFRAPVTTGLSFFAVAAHRQSTCSALLELSNGGEIEDISFDSLTDSFQFEVLNSTVSATAGVFPVGKLELIEALQTSDPIQPVAELRTNGVAVGGGPVQSPKDVVRANNFIGKSLYADCPAYPGAIAEIILYGRRLDVDERVAVEDYLKKKWQCCD